MKLTCVVILTSACAGMSMAPGSAIAEDVSPIFSRGDFRGASAVGIDRPRPGSRGAQSRPRQSRDDQFVPTANTPFPDGTISPN
jgi:hypothetical protein